MSPRDEAHFNKILVKQVAMVEDTWDALQRAGVTGDTQLRLDCLYYAPGESEAHELAEFLGHETDYDVRVESDAGGFLKKATSKVASTTQPTRVSLDILEEWVRWMVAAGAQYDCEFDGWGAKVPRSA